MLKRSFDILVSTAGLLATAPLWVPCAVAIYLQDRHSPFYIAPRMGRGGRPFQMIKLRSMVVNADKSGVDSTSNSDNRITWIGSFVRKFKVDELPQLFNVLKGEMSLVGPRPQVKRGTDVYTAEERKILDVRPGITDFSSIVFSDEGDILTGKPDPDAAYDQLIRPWKSRLCLAYIKHQSLWLDIQLVALTALAIVSKPQALYYVGQILQQLGVDAELQKVASRQNPLYPALPPGALPTPA